MHALEDYDFVLAEGAIAERLRRIPGIELHPELFNSPFIYDPELSRQMASIHSEYYAVAREAGVPILSTAPTWRLDQSRLKNAGFPMSMNRDAIQFLQKLRASTLASHPDHPPILVGALIGPQNDCYSPDLAPAAEEAKHFHQWQINEHARAGADFMLAQTIPALSEAIGIVEAAMEHDTPLVVSFCINKEMQILDGTPLNEAIEALDKVGPPLGYAVNCVYPSTLDLTQLARPERMLGIWSNASSLSHSELEKANKTQGDSIEDWNTGMQRLRKQGLKILGGCCGTNTRYIEKLTAL